jgi:hypothetical protein
MEGGKWLRLMALFDLVLNGIDSQCFSFWLFAFGF